MQSYMIKHDRLRDKRHLPFDVILFCMSYCSPVSLNDQRCDVIQVTEAKLMIDEW